MSSHRSYRCADFPVVVGRCIAVKELRSAPITEMCFAKGAEHVSTSLAPLDSRAAGRTCFCVPSAPSLALQLVLLL